MQILAGCLGATLTLTNPHHQQDTEPLRPLAQGAAGVDPGRIFLLSPLNPDRPWTLAGVGGAAPAGQGVAGADPGGAPGGGDRPAGGHRAAGVRRGRLHDRPQPGPGRRAHAVVTGSALEAPASAVDTAAWACRVPITRCFLDGGHAVSQRHCESPECV